MENTDKQEFASNESQPEGILNWDELHFEGKEWCRLDSENNLVLNATDHNPERILANLSPANAQLTINALSEKFNEVESKFSDFKKELDAAEEPEKLSGKLQRMKSYLLGAHALGDYQSMLRYVQEKEEGLQNLNQNHIKARQHLVDKAESLKESSDWKQTTEKYKQLVEEWRMAPHVDKESNDQLWAKIEAARNHFYERKRAHTEAMEKEMMQNLDQKLEICEEAEHLAKSDNWRETSDKFKALMDRWKSIGKVATPEKSEELWSRFTAAKNAFFDRKGAHQGDIAKEQAANLEEKLKLVEEAEAIKDSTEWKKTAQRYAEILESWKKIGKVPFEKADEIWNRMQAAKDCFFSAKRQHSENFKVGLEDNYAQKKALVERIESLKDATNWREATEEINELMTTWKTIGPVPREYGDELWEQFIKARKYFFKRKDEDRDNRKNRFVGQVQNRLNQSRQFLQKLEDELKEDEERLAEFHDTLNSTEEEDAKDKEIKKHVSNLVQQLERRLPSKRSKIEDVKMQIEELEQKLKQKK